MRVCDRGGGGGIWFGGMATVESASLTALKRREEDAA